MLKPEHRLRSSLILSLLLGIWLTSVRLEAQIFSLSEQQEIELGREASKKVETDMPMLRDGDVTDYVNRLGQNLVRYSHRSNLRYSFKVVNSPEINAFALPGGFIYLNRGLLEAADNENEVAGVLGHEISHVVARHSADQMKKAGIASLILGGLGAALGGKGGAVAGMTKLGAEVGTNAAFMKFSRDDERQADELGARNVYDAGYNPEGMVTFFEKLEHIRKSEPSKLETFFSTHPSPSERVANVSHEIRAFPRKGNLKTDDPDFHSLKNRLNSLPKPPTPKQRGEVPFLPGTHPFILENEARRKGTKVGFLSKAKVNRRAPRSDAEKTSAFLFSSFFFVPFVSLW